MDIKTAGNLKNSTLLDWNTNTEGPEKENSQAVAAACIILHTILQRHI